MKATVDGDQRMRLLAEAYDSDHDEQQRLAGPRAVAGGITAEALARRFHEAYERLAPEHGYHTRAESAVPWERVPEANRRLMIAVCAEILAKGFGYARNG